MKTFYVRTSARVHYLYRVEANSAEEVRRMARKILKENQSLGDELQTEDGNWEDSPFKYHSSDPWYGSGEKVEEITEA